MNFVSLESSSDPRSQHEKQPPVFVPKTKANNHDIYFKGTVRRDVSGLETSRRCFRKNRPSHNRARALQLKGAISYSNEQMRSKAHSALTAPLVLHHTRIYECAMKQKSFSTDGINIFSMAFYHSSMGAMNAARLLKKDVKKTHQFCLISMGKSGPSAQ